MREVIESIIDAEKEAEKMISEAKNTAMGLISQAESDVSIETRKHRETEIKRFNQEVQVFEESRSKLIQKEQHCEVNIPDTSNITEKIINRIKQTVFDQQR